MPGGDCRVRKELLVSLLDHLHRFKEMLRITQMLPEGDIPMPNAALQVEWFYMTFHRSNRLEYLRSGRKLCDETLASLATYFESGFDARVADGTLRKLRNEQVCVKARNEYRHELQARYHDKLKRLANNRRRKQGWQRDRDGGSHGGKSRKRATHRERKPDARDHGKRKTAHEQAAKKPCHVHGPEAKHLYDECRTNPKNQRSATTTTTSARTMPTTTTSANTRAGLTLIRTLPNLPGIATGRLVRAQQPRLSRIIISILFIFPRRGGWEVCLTSPQDLRYL
jgi:hypothetical protein